MYVVYLEGIKIHLANTYLFSGSIHLHIRLHPKQPFPFHLRPQHIRHLGSKAWGLMNPRAGKVVKGKEVDGERLCYFLEFGEFATTRINSLVIFRFKRNPMYFFL